MNLLSNQRGHGDYQALFFMIIGSLICLGLFELSAIGLTLLSYFKWNSIPLTILFGIFSIVGIVIIIKIL